MHRLVYLTSASALMIAVTAASAEDMPQMQHHQADSAFSRAIVQSCDSGLSFP